MKAYLFSAWISRISDGHLTDDCVSLIICGGELDEARGRFEVWLRGDDSEAVKIERVQSTPFVDQLFTEAGPVSLDWRAIANQIDAAEESVLDDDGQQGYWVDVNQIVATGASSSDIEALRKTLSEDLREGINWAPDRQFYFLLSALSPQVHPHAGQGTLETRADEAADEVKNTGASDDLGWLNLRQRDARFSEMMEKKVVVLLRARNSVVAASLWRRFTVLQNLPATDLRIDPLFGILGPADSTTGA